MILRLGLLVAGLAALAIAPWFLADARGRTVRDPVASAFDWMRVPIGMPRSRLEHRLRWWYLRPDGVDVFRHPDAPALAIDIRLDGPGQDARVVAVGDPYLLVQPQTNHLRSP